MKIKGREIDGERIVVCAYMCVADVSVHEGDYKAENAGEIYAYIAQDIDYNGLNRVPLHKKWERVIIREISWAPLLQNVEG